MITEVLPVELLEIEKDSYHPFVTLRIGRYKSRLLLDTGASRCAFDEKKVQRLLKKGQRDFIRVQSVGLGSAEVKSHLGILASLRFGGVVVKDLEVAILDLSHVNDAYRLLNLPEVDGVMGSDLLKQLKAEISYAKHTLKVKG